MQKLGALENGESSRTMFQRVEAARTIQQTRLAPLHRPTILTNGDTRPAEVQQYCPLTKEGRQMVRLAVARIGLTARAYHRVLKLKGLPSFPLALG